MGTAKRERQKANRQARIEAAQQEQSSSARNRRFGLIAAGVVGILLLAFLYSVTAGGDNTTEEVDATADPQETTADNTPAAETTDNTSEQPAVETIEEWVQGAGDLAPADRDEIYADVGPPPMTIDTTATYEAVIKTADGDMRLDLYAEEAPLAVNNFVNLAEDGFYDGLTFHRALANFMAQGGDPTGLGTGGPGYQFDNEYTEGIEFDERGRLAMANSGPDTNGSQFFITFESLDGRLSASGFTVFGQLTDGDDVLGAIDLREPSTATEPGTIIESIRIETSAE